MNTGLNLINYYISKLVFQWKNRKDKFGYGQNNYKVSYKSCHRFGVHTVLYCVYSYYARQTYDNLCNSPCMQKMEIAVIVCCYWYYKCEIQYDNFQLSSSKVLSVQLSFIWFFTSVFDIALSSRSSSNLMNTVLVKLRLMWTAQNTTPQIHYPHNVQIITQPRNW